MGGGGITWENSGAYGVKEREGKGGGGGYT